MKYSQLSDYNLFLEYRKFAEDLAVKAGKLVLAGQKKLQIVKYKDLQDVTTSVDLEFIEWDGYFFEIASMMSFSDFKSTDVVTS